MNDATLIRRSAKLLMCDLSGETVLLHPESRLYFSLNEMGAAIWHALTTPRRLVEIEESLLQKLDMPRAHCRRDLLAFLARMSQAGLLEIADVQMGHAA